MYIVLYVLSSLTNLKEGVEDNICASLTPYMDLTPSQLYPSVDFREMQLITAAKDQGNCNSSYAFQTIAIMENSILRDKKNLNEFWQSKANVSLLSLSEQFLMSNSICKGCNYCYGGRFDIELNLIIPFNQYQIMIFPSLDEIQTFELTENFPYKYSANFDNWKQRIQLKSVLDINNYLTPVQILTNKNEKCGQLPLDGTMKTPVILVFDDINSTFNASTVQRLKSYLSRGIAIALQMYMGNDEQRSIFSQFEGGSVLKQSCPSWNADHQVVLVGYGRKYGKDVWIIKNSFGSSWGENGFFFVEIGSNSFCLEQYAYTFLPKYFDKSPYPRGNIQRGQKNQLDCDKYFTNQNGVITCYNSCPNTFPLLDVVNNQCLNSYCPAKTPYKESQSCVNRCSTGYYIVNGSELQCVQQCDMFLLNIISNSMNCITQCPAYNPFYQNGGCVSRCNSGIYSSGILRCQDSCIYYIYNVSNDYSKQCFEQCPTNLPYSDNGQCSSRCTSGIYQNISGILICQMSCQNYAIINESNQNSYYCVDICRSPHNFKDGKICKQSCQFYKQIDNSEVCECLTSCPIFELVNNNKKCINACQAKQTVINGQCVDDTQQETKSNQKTILISVSAVTGFIIFVLILAIFCTICCKKKNSRKYQKQVQIKQIKITKPMNILTNYTTDLDDSKLIE
ncbi:Cathepsin_L [Hexamita inflata]|uniref:Cathepsin_L n=1 Tax=Hexamita inflata TaxID=28002 RepID=A0ABP1KH83_9EUKA